MQQGFPDTVWNPVGAPYNKTYHPVSLILRGFLMSYRITDNVFS